MKRTLLTATLTTILLACSQPSETLETFGDGAFLIGDAFCTRDIECSGRAEESLPVCIDSQMFSLCISPGPWDCALPLDDREAAMFEQCADDLLARECGGQFTDTCLSILNIQHDKE